MNKQILDSFLESLSYSQKREFSYIVSSARQRTIKKAQSNYSGEGVGGRIQIEPKTDVERYNKKKQNIAAAVAHYNYDLHMGLY